VKIGIVGGYGHEGLKRLPGAELAWACDGYDQQAVTRGAALGCKRIFPSMESLLTDFQPDLVYIGTVYAGNGRLAVQALEQGFDVVSEKPLAADWETLNRLSALTASGERRAIAEFAMRWSAPFQKARELILGGAIGKVAMIQAQKTYKFGTARPDFYKSRELFGGIILWVAVHALDYAAWCTGLQYDSVTAMHGNHAFPDYLEMEDHAALLFQMTGGVPCVITADFLRPSGAARGDDRLRITGSDGVVEVRNNDVFLTDSREEHHWVCPTEDSVGIQLAEDLAAAALGSSAAQITTAECLHITAAAIAAREAADTGCRQLIQG